MRTCGEQGEQHADKVPDLEYLGAENWGEDGEEIDGEEWQVVGGVQRKLSETMAEAHATHVFTLAAARDFRDLGRRTYMAVRGNSVASAFLTAPPREKERIGNCEYQTAWAIYNAVEVPLIRDAGWRGEVGGTGALTGTKRKKRGGKRDPEGGDGEKRGSEKSESEIESESEGEEGGEGEGDEEMTELQMYCADFPKSAGLAQVGVRWRHARMLGVLHDVVRTNSIKHELEPNGLFASAVDTAVLGEGGVGPEADLLYWIRTKQKIMDLKTVSSSRTYFIKRHEGHAASAYERDEQTKLKREVKRWDEKMVGTDGRDRDIKGEAPIQGRLNHFGGMTYCAIGRYGDAGKGMMKFLSQLAHERGEKVWKRFGCKNTKEAAPLCMVPIVRRVGIAAVKFRAMQIREAFDSYCRRKCNAGRAKARRNMVYEARREEERISEQFMDWGPRGGDDYFVKGKYGDRLDARWKSVRGC